VTEMFSKIGKTLLEVLGLRLGDIQVPDIKVLQDTLTYFM
jgi:hypothetical protein